MILSSESENEKPSNSPGEAKKTLLLLCLGSILTFASLGMTRSLVVLMASDLGASAFWVGVIVAAYAFVPFFLALHIGAAADQYGPRLLIILGSVGFALAMVIIAVSPSVVGIIVSQILAGVCQLCCVLAYQTYVSSIGSSADLESNFGWYTAANSIGQLLGPVLGGLVADQVSYETAFWISALLSAATAGLVSLLPAAKDALKRQELVHIQLPIVRELLQRGGVKVAMTSSFAVLFTMGARQAFFPLLLQNLGYGATHVGLLNSIQAGAGLATRPFIGMVVKLVGNRLNALVVTVSLAGIGLILIPAGQSLVFFSIVSILIGTGTGLAQPLSMLIVADNSSEQERGLAMGLRLMGNRLAQMVNPLLFGLITSFSGLNAAFVTGGSLLIGSAVALTRWRDAVGGRPTSSERDLSA